MCFSTSCQVSELKCEGKHFVVHYPRSYSNGKDILDFLENYHRYFLELFLYGMPRNVSVIVVEGLSSAGIRGRALIGEYMIEVNASSWDCTPIRGVLLHELTHVWQMSRYNGRPWFNEGFAYLMPLVIFDITGNTADRAMYLEEVIADLPRGDLTDDNRSRGHAFDILYGYTKCSGADWIRRFLSYLKADHNDSTCGSDLTTDTNIVAYLSAALKRDLSDFYIKQGLPIQKTTVIAVMKRWESGPSATVMVAVVCVIGIVAVAVYSRELKCTRQPSNLYYGTLTTQHTQAYTY